MRGNCELCSWRLRRHAASPAASPDGTKVAFRAAVDGVMNVWAGRTVDPAEFDPALEAAVAIFTSRVGDHQTEEGRTFLELRSALPRVDNISKRC